MANHPTLGEGARATISDPAVSVFVSAATMWEISIKRALGKLEGLVLLTADRRIHRYGVKILGV